MSLRREYDDDNHSFSDYSLDEDRDNLPHRKMIRKRLEERLEKKRLKEEFDELDGEFDWDEFEK